MIGCISLKVKDSKNTYSFELKRNITILCGDSGRGKTTLFEIVEDFNRYGKASAARVICNKNVIAFRGDPEWKTRLSKIKDSVIIIDEDSSFIRSKEFAETIKGTDNYYLLITREYLENLPYSVEEIYELVGNKNKKFKKIYKNIEKIYHDLPNQLIPFKTDLIITEDGKSGYQFFKKVADSAGIECIAAQGKANIYNLLVKYQEYKTLVVADGAAFGPEIRDVVKYQKMNKNPIGIFLPESFEWLILKSGLVCDKDIKELITPEEFVDSIKYFSWEQYFTALLVEITKESKFSKYPKNKNKLPKYYVKESSIIKIESVMNGIDFRTK